MWKGYTKLIKNTSSINIKDGNNGKASWCYTNAQKYKDKLYISIVFGPKSFDKRWGDVRKLT